MFEIAVFILTITTFIFLILYLDAYKEYSQLCDYTKGIYRPGDKVYYIDDTTNMSDVVHVGTILNSYIQNYNKFIAAGKTTYYEFEEKPGKYIKAKYIIGSVKE